MVLPFQEDLYANGVFPSNVLLIVEVSDITLNKDIHIKLPIYANAGIPEVWIIDIKNKQLLQFTDNKGGKYQKENTLSGEDQITASLLPLSTQVKDLLGA